MSALVDDGFKRVRGRLTEGRYLTLETLGLALSNRDGQYVDATPTTKNHERIEQRWIIHAVPAAYDEFYLQSAMDKKYIAGFPDTGKLTSDRANAQAFVFSYSPDGAVYGVRVTEVPVGGVSVSSQNPIAGSQSPVNWESPSLGQFEIYSVSYKK